MKRPKTQLGYLRLRNILSQQDVADMLGISQAYYCKLESNPEKISLGMAIELKNLFQVEKIDDLLNEAM